MRLLLHVCALAGGVHLLGKARKTIGAILRARALTKLVEREAELATARLGQFRALGGWAEEEEDPEPEEFRVLKSGEIAATDQDGVPISLPPDAPAMSELTHEQVSRRARNFMQYWCARVHEKFSVVGNWDRAALACTRIWLCKAMKEPRTYYVSVAQADGRVVREPRHRKGMHTSQIAACVDWIVTAAHRGTIAQAAQVKVRNESRSNWIMRLFGVDDTVGGW